MQGRADLPVPLGSFGRHDVAIVAEYSRSFSNIAVRWILVAFYGHVTSPLDDLLAYPSRFLRIIPYPILCQRRIGRKPVCLSDRKCEFLLQKRRLRLGANVTHSVTDTEEQVNAQVLRRPARKP